MLQFSIPENGEKMLFANWSQLKNLENFLKKKLG
jgi:hypothetical protein